MCHNFYFATFPSLQRSYIFRWLAAREALRQVGWQVCSRLIAVKMVIKIREGNPRPCSTRLTFIIPSIKQKNECIVRAYCLRLLPLIYGYNDDCERFLLCELQRFGWKPSRVWRKTKKEEIFSRPDFPMTGCHKERRAQWIFSNK